MKVGIVTITGRNPNYGNRLQNYAIVRLLISRGIRVTTINTQSQYRLWKFQLKSFVNRISNYKFSQNQALFEKQINFLHFSQKYLFPSNDLIKGCFKPQKYDFFILGSDQVWNPTWYDDIKKHAFLLTFANDDQKIPLSPSFGLERLPDEWIDWFKTNLSSFPMISVREKTGAAIINDLLQKRAEVLIDPTLMLDAAEWINVAKKPRKMDIKKRYILTYVLGDEAEDIAKDANRISAEYGLEVYNLLDEKQPSIFSAGPSEFIYLVANSELILTDSFHACVFSFLFRKPFLVYQRTGKNNNMFSRISDFLDMFGLRRKYVGSEMENFIFESDYSAGFETLVAERAKVCSFLSKASKGRLM